ncbi:MAG: IclR family transcriptional regulator [Acetobacteraceae bacterium]|nr:IclR family transcriptional regulator [Acetobacteraceae bacterium]
MIGFALIRALEQSGGPVPLKTLAAAAEMSPGQAHAYLASFRAVGLVRQGPDGLYELGPYALMLGLAALDRLDVREAAREAMQHFREQCGESVHLSVWSGQGPVIVSRLDGTRGVSLSIRIGFALPLSTSASGRIFAAYLPEAEQLAGQSMGRQTRAEWRRTCEEVRRSGLAISESLVNTGFAAVSTPVFDHEGHLAAAMTALGPATQLDTRPESPVVAALRQAGATTSAAMGWGVRSPLGSDRLPAR